MMLLADSALLGAREVSSSERAVEGCMSEEMSIRQRSL